MKRAFTIIDGLVVLGIALVLAAILYPVFHRPHCEGRRGPCQVNLKNIVLAAKHYSADNGEHFPRASYSTNGVFGWGDAIAPYRNGDSVLQCPAEGNAGSRDTPREVGYTDYWYNAHLSGKSEVVINETSVAFGDGNDGTGATDARYSLDSVPQVWIGNKNSPLYRHLDGLNLAYVDGHVKWIRAENIVRSGLNLSPVQRRKMLAPQ